jgi:CHAT domain-containing protein
MQHLATAETTTGNLLNAIRVSEDVLPQIPRNRLGVRLNAEQGLVHQYSLIGDFDSARKYLREAEESFGRLRNSPGWAKSGARWTSLMERARGETFSAEGNLLAAEQAFRKAVKYAQEHAQLIVQQDKTEGRSRQISGTRRYVEVLQRSLAGVLWRRGRIVEAESLARQATRSALERVGRSSTDTGQGLNLLSRIIAEQGRYAEAAKLTEEALKTFELSGSTPESFPVMSARKQIGSILASQGRYEEAIAAFKLNNEALKKAPELTSKMGIGDLDWVLAMLRTGDQKGAEEMADRMLRHVAGRFGDKDLRTHTVRAFYAMTLAARGDYFRAKDLFEMATPQLIEQSRQGGETEAGTIQRQQRLTLILESYIQVLAEIGKTQEHTTSSATESFRLADIARSSAVQRALTASAARATIRDPKLADLARREQDAQGRIAALSDLLTQLLSATPEQQLPKIQVKMATDIEVLKGERSRLKLEIEKSFPEYADLVDPKPVTVVQAQATLKPGETLLSYYFGETQGYVWALQKVGTIGFATIPLGRKEMAERVGKLRRSLDPRVEDIDRMPAFDLALAHDLFSRLVQPVARSLENTQRLLVVPHGELGQLPFALLPTQLVDQPGRTTVPFAGYRGIPWLTRQYAIEQLPSVTALASLRKLPAANDARRSFIGFGDPLFSRAQAAALQLAAKPLKTRGVPLRLRNLATTSQVNSAELAILPRLPDTGAEITEIARVLKAGPEDVFLQLKATETEVMAADLAQRRVVMFATHGLVPGDLNGLTQPALALTAPELSDGNGDGLLTLDEILSLKLNADWVVLSACNTASGDGAGSEAVSGLGRAFFYAGARALLVSNWPVETVSARLLMTDLFRRQVENPLLNKAEALQQAILALADGPGAIDPKTGKADYAYAHPLFWAPFVIVGD